jgi:N-acetyl-anhydromuramoyl-L-alanine amidase
MAPSDKLTRLPGIKQADAPFFRARPEGVTVSLLVIHNISLPAGEFGTGYVDQLFRGTLKKNHPALAKAVGNNAVSAHFFIDRQGEATQYVSVQDAAWHAGDSSFQQVSDCNDYSIGIELEGSDDVPYTSEQYAALGEITRLLMYHFPAITWDRIVGHSDIAPSRKTDPGASFDWTRYQQLLEGAE